MRRIANIVMIVLVAVYISALAVTVYRTHKEEQTRRCLEQYGEGDLGMCMCTEQCD